MGMAMDKSSDVEISSLSSGSTTSHPVGVPYTMSPDLVSTPPDGKFPNGVRLIDGKVECASCHNPHSATSAPFLATSNEGSNLCYTCHVK
jgi:predicted CXXCH cytochrome family protein